MRKAGWIVAALCAATVQDGSAQTTAERFRTAQAALTQLDYPTMIRELRVVIEDSAADPRAWNMLGFALRRSGEWREAIPLHQRAMATHALVPMASYHVGMAFAAGGLMDSAFHWLLQAKATGRVNMTQAGADPLAPVLRADARYRSLYPSEEEYAHPFVEDARIIREWRGEAAGDQFGWIARNIGDVDDDGIADVVTSSPTYGANGTNHGRVYVYSSGRGTLLWTATGDSASQLGLGVEAAGDVNADGIPDVAAGAPFAGRAYVYDGRTGRVLHTFSGEAQGSAFGRRVSRAGDLDGDGHADVAVSAPNHANGTGRVSVFSGRDGRILATMDGEASGDAFGSALSGRDWNGTSLIVVGAASAGANNGGRVYLYRGHPPALIFTIDGDGESVALGGMFVSVIGDIDADGVADFHGSDWNANASGRPGSGRIHIHSGKDGRELLVMGGEAAGDGFGVGPADAGDVDGDGHDDIVTGAWQVASVAPSGGAAYVISGRTGEVLRKWTGRLPGETFGFDATGLGDVDGDGGIDFLVTSAWSAINDARSGRVYIMSGAGLRK